MASIHRKTLAVVVVLLLCMFAYGCSPVIRTGIRMAHPALENIEASLFQQDNLVLAEQGLPGTIMLLEGMLESSPNDMLLQTMAIKAYLGLGMLVEDKDPKQATALYTKGSEWGMAALKRHRKFRQACEEGMKIGEAAQLITDKDYVPALLWTAACMGSNVLLNMGDPMIVVDLAAVKALADQANMIDDDYFHGFAYIFIGTVNSILPATFGGDRNIARSAFETLDTMNKGNFLLAKVFFAKFYQTEDKLAKAAMQDVVDAPDKLMPEIELMNQIAKSKAGQYLEAKEGV